MVQKQILENLPFKSSFRFVDTIVAIDSNNTTVNYTLKKDAFFYEDHFQGYPVTPGSILTEIMAQGGLVVPGMYLLATQNKEKDDKRRIPLLASAEVNFYRLVFPGEKLTVISKKQYFRFNKLKCAVELLGEDGTLVAKGILSGMIKEIL